MAGTFDIALFEKPGEGRLTDVESMELTSLLKDGGFYPIEIEADHAESSAMGFIHWEAARELNYDYDELKSCIGGILDDLDESASRTYEFEGLKIYLGHNDKKQIMSEEEFNGITVLVRQISSLRECIKALKATNCAVDLAKIKDFEINGRWALIPEAKKALVVMYENRLAECEKSLKEVIKDA